MIERVSIKSMKSAISLFFLSSFVVATFAGPSPTPLYVPPQVVGPSKVMNSCSFVYKGVLKSPYVPLNSADQTDCVQLNSLRSVWLGPDSTAAQSAADTLYGVVSRILNRNAQTSAGADGFYYQALKSAEKICTSRGAFLTFADHEGERNPINFEVKKSYCQLGATANRYYNAYHYRCMKCEFVTP